MRVASELSAWEAERLADRSNPNGAIERTLAELNRWHDVERAEIRWKTVGLLPPARGAIDLRSGGAIDDSVRGGGIAGGGGGGTEGQRGGGVAALAPRRAMRPAPNRERLPIGRPATSGQSRGGASRPGSGTLMSGSQPPTWAGRGRGSWAEGANLPQPPKPSPRTGRDLSVRGGAG